MLQKYKKIILLVLVTIFLIWSINVTTVPREKASLPQRIIGYIVLPSQKGFNFIKNELYQAYLFFHEIAATKGEKERLSLEVQQLNEQLRAANDVVKENERLKQMLGLKNEMKNEQVETAQVIGRNPDNLNSMIIINKGTNYGLKINDEVLAANRGLIGRITEVSTNWSKVLLITDPESSISSINDRTRELAVVRGDALASKYNYIKMIYIMPEADIQVNDVIITSGFGGVFTKGTLIGTVKEIKQEGNQLTRYAYIEPAVDFKRLEEVVVLKTNKEGNK